MPNADTPLSLPDRGMSPRQAARLIGVAVSKILTWVRSGEMPAINVASVRCGKPQYRILPHHLAQWERGRMAAPPPRPRRRRKRSELVDYFPD